MDDLDKIKKFKDDIDDMQVPVEIDFAIERGLKRIEKRHKLRQFRFYFIAAVVIFILTMFPLKTIIQNFYLEKTVHLDSKGIAYIGSYENLKRILNVHGSTCENQGLSMRIKGSSQKPNTSTIAENQDHSSTNLQVNGVDEPDIVKNDSKFIYTIDPKSNKLTIINAYPAQNMKVQTRISLGSSFHPNNMILKDNYLIVLGDYSTDGLTDNYSKHAGYKFGNTKVLVYDIKNTKNPSLVKSLVVSGEYNDARLIADKIYVISNKRVTISSDDDNKYDSTPFYIDSSLKGKTKRIDYKDIAYDPKDIYPNYMVVSSIDLSNVNKESCVTVVLGDGSNIYCNEDNLYLVSQNSADKTIIYKFKFSNGKAVFENRSELEGKINNQFSMDEYKGYLRIAVTKNNKGITGISDSIKRVDEKKSSVNSVYVLDKNMKVVSQISDIANGEIIYSTRFVGDKAYVVTYKETDPLFVIDFSNPKKPKITGKLEMPGFSTYLQPYDENHIIGFGRNSTDISEGGTVVAKPGDIKFAMFDVSDILNPKQMYKVDINETNSSSQVLYNHRALLFDKNKEIIAFPIKIANGGKISFGIYVYKVDLKNGFKLLGKVMSESENTIDGNGSQDVRAIYIGNTLYTVFDSKVVASNINSLATVKQINMPN